MATLASSLARQSGHAQSPSRTSFSELPHMAPPGLAPLHELPEAVTYLMDVVEECGGDLVRRCYWDIGDFSDWWRQYRAVPLGEQFTVGGWGCGCRVVVVVVRGGSAMFFICVCVVYDASAWSWSCLSCQAAWSVASLHSSTPPPLSPLPAEPGHWAGRVEPAALVPLPHGTGSAGSRHVPRHHCSGPQRGISQDSTGPGGQGRNVSAALLPGLHTVCYAVHLLPPCTCYHLHAR